MTRSAAIASVFLCLRAPLAGSSWIVASIERSDAMSRRDEIAVHRPERSNAHDRWVRRR